MIYFWEQQVVRTRDECYSSVGSFAVDWAAVNCPSRHVASGFVLVLVHVWRANQALFGVALGGGLTPAVHYTYRGSDASCVSSSECFVQGEVNTVSLFSDARREDAEARMRGALKHACTDGRTTYQAVRPCSSQRRTATFNFLRQGVPIEIFSIK